MNDARKERLAAFVDWAAANVAGDEMGQAQIFLDRLFRAFGQRGSLDAMAFTHDQLYNIAAAS